MTQKLELSKRMKVLEVGTGSGYQAAVLAKLCRRLYSIERHQGLLALAEEKFRSLRINNVMAIAGDGTKGWPQQAPFDRIIVTAAASRELPETLLQQLSPDGILIAPIGESVRDQYLYRFRFDEYGFLNREKLWPVRFVPLVGEADGAERD